ncbi:MAG: efflux RND transporter permease subunit [Bacteroidetes bacterium]|nr:MAG: efflux RND transporter permease subunit [Bacteroidota bacterium]
MNIAEISIKRPSLIIIIFAAISVIGIFCYNKLQYELLPKISPPIVTVTTVYPGASPEEVETNVSKILENAVSGMDKVSAVRSSSQEGISLITIELLQNANRDLALQDAQRKVSAALGLLPKDVRTPILGKIAIDETPVLRIGITSTMPSKDFYQFLLDDILPRLNNIEGVADISLLGGDAREIKVNLDVDKVQGFGLAIASVTNSIKMANMEIPTGKITENNSQFVVRLAGKFNTLDEMRNLVIGFTKQGGEIRLQDVAEVQDSNKEYTRINRIDGNLAIGMWLLKQSDANAVTVSHKVREELTKIEKEYANRNLKFDIAQDSSIFTVEAADAVKHDLFLAVLLVAGVMMVFLHSIRNSLIVMVSIPASLMGSFIAMYLFGFSLNLMTLLGLSLVIGILVDDSIVVLENIHRHLEMGKNSRDAALDGRAEIGFTAIGITLVDVVVFVPLSLLSGIVGNIMREFAIVVLVSTLMSLFVSFTITPMLASRFIKLEHLNSKSFFGSIGLWFERQITALISAYEIALRWSLKYPVIVSLLVFASFVGAITLAKSKLIGTEFITPADKGEFSVLLELPSGSSFQNTNHISQQVEDILRSMPQVQKVYANVGASSEGFSNQSANNISEIIVTLVPKLERLESTDEMILRVKNKIQEIPGIKPRVSPIGIFGTANQTPIQMIVSGSNPDSVKKSVKMIYEVYLKIAGTSEVRLSAEDGKPETRIEIDREKMASFGLTVAEVGQMMQIALKGDDNSKLRQGNTEYDIRIALDEFDKSKTENLAYLKFTNRLGQQIELQQFAKVFQSLGPTKLQRENRNTSISIFSQVYGRTSGAVAADLDKGIAELKLPLGVKTVYNGDIKNAKESAESMGLAMGIGILFVYMIMVALYDSFVYPFVVLFSIPVAIVGAFLALALTMKAINIFSQLGLIMMIGLVAKNAILLVDFTNEQKLQGMTTKDALILAGRERLRPILMTTLAMVIGMMPIALADSAGSEWKTGLAWVLIGGLTSSMFLTLVFVPVVYQTVDKIKAFLGKIFGKKEELAAV